MKSIQVGLNFISALDSNHVDAIRKTVDTSGTWWVDTGLDRASGVHNFDPGDNRPWPLHGQMPMEQKVDLLSKISTRFPGGIRQTAWNSFSFGEFVVIEVDGYGITDRGGLYENRYAFVIEVRGERVLNVREYLDTLHASNLFSAKNLDRISSVEDFQPVKPETLGLNTDIALRFCQALSDGDSDNLCAISSVESTWWADSGINRPRGKRDSPIERNPALLMMGNSLTHDRAKLIPKLRSTFNGGWTLLPTRIFSDGSSICIEALSNGVRSKDSKIIKSYQNRYCFILELNDSKISSVREYCDTAHAFDVFRLGA